MNKIYKIFFGIIFVTLILGETLIAFAAESAKINVARTTPVNGATDIYVISHGDSMPNYDIIVEFSDAIQFVNKDSYSQISVLDKSGKDVFKTSGIDNSNSIIIFPTLSNDSKYTVNIPEGIVMDEDGNVNKAYSFSFSTSTTSILSGNTLSSEFSPEVKQKITNAVVLFVGNSSAYINGNEAQVDSDSVSVYPLIKNGRTLVPIRFISESLGAKVTWNGSTSTVKISLVGKTIKMIIGSKRINTDGVESDLEVPAQTINNRTFIPLRALVEALGKKVFWDDRGLIVISDNENVINQLSDRSLIDKIAAKFLTDK